jgi:N,N'-diacetyllegionaminate synthase
MHCTSNYPTPFEQVNLRAMKTIENEFGISVGYSDHTMGIEVPIAAVALGATIIEKHFTLDREMDGPDHLASLEPNELKAMCHSIRNVSISLGNSEKQPTDEECDTIKVARKSIHSKHFIKKGQQIEMNDLQMLRPGIGISPMKLNEILGMKALRDIPPKTLMSWNLIG